MIGLFIQIGQKAVILLSFLASTAAFPKAK